MASSSLSASAASVPDSNNNPRKQSNASSSIDSETGRLLTSLGSVGSSLADVGTGLPPLNLTPTQKPGESLDEFQIPAAVVPKHYQHLQTASSSSNKSPGNMDDSSSIHDNMQSSLLPPPPPPPSQLSLLSSSSHHQYQHYHHALEENCSHTSSKDYLSRNLPERRLQPKKRKMSYESYDSAMGDSYLGLAPLDNSILPKQEDMNSSVTSDNGGGVGAAASAAHHHHHHHHHPILSSGPVVVSALDHLDALGDTDESGLPVRPAKALRKSPPPAAADESASATAGGAGGTGAGAGELSLAAHAYGTIHGQYKREGGGAGSDEGDDNSSSNATFTSSGHRLLMEAIMMTSGGLDMGGRKRLESWGGMSDLSVPIGSDNAAAAIAATALHHTGIIDDVTAAANFGGGSVSSSVTDDHHFRPLGEALPHHYHHHLSQQYHHAGRERKESTTSFSDSTFPVPPSLDGLEISSDLQKFVAAAVASVGDQLAELAVEIESAAAVVNLDRMHKDDDTRQGSEVSSIATPLVIGASLDDGQNSAQQASVHDHSASSKQRAEAAAAAAAISVDYDAVAAAVDAAQAATGGLDLSTIGDGDGGTAFDGMGGNSMLSSATGGGGKPPRVKRKLPTHKKRPREHYSDPAEAPPSNSDSFHLLSDVPKSYLSEEEREAIRERARRAAGYVPPSELLDDPNALKTPKNKALPPFKKRIKKMTPDPEPAKSNSHVTPKISNTSSSTIPNGVGSGPTPSTVASSSKSGGKEKSTQKWESMFDALVDFVDERRKEETKGFTDEEIADWIWDGNVPTTYKTKDGKALGRWINNQRSAKSKGTLKEDREERLVDTGLKWSVLSSNSWNEMLDELRIYIRDYTKDGKKWDGNVPTNYRIKAQGNGRKKLTEEDKNLGRWVNRQRSLYQSGKLRKDRQLALEKVGLKWSMLATTSWDGMFETLMEYIEEKTKNGAQWDGNVPANFKTNDNPPRALGRWINRQRSAYVKNKLKQEYNDKLCEVGLKWSVHERKCPEEIRSDDAEDFEDEPQPVAGPDSNTECRDLVAPCTVLSSTIPPTIAIPSKEGNQQLSQKVQTIHTETSAGHTEPSNSDQLSPSSQDTVKGSNQQATNAPAEMPERVGELIPPIDSGQKLTDTGKSGAVDSSDDVKPFIGLSGTTNEIKQPIPTSTAVSAGSQTSDSTTKLAGFTANAEQAKVKKASGSAGDRRSSYEEVKNIDEKANEKSTEDPDHLEISKPASPCDEKDRQSTCNVDSVPKNHRGHPAAFASSIPAGNSMHSVSDDNVVVLIQPDSVPSKTDSIATVASASCAAELPNQPQLLACSGKDSIEKQLESASSSSNTKASIQSNSSSVEWKSSIPKESEATNPCEPSGPELPALIASFTDSKGGSDTEEKDSNGVCTKQPPAGAVENEGQEKNCPEPVDDRISKPESAESGSVHNLKGNDEKGKRESCDTKLASSMPSNLPTSTSNQKTDPDAVDDALDKTVSSEGNTGEVTTPRTYAASSKAQKDRASSSDDVIEENRKNGATAEDTKAKEENEDNGKEISDTTGPIDSELSQTGKEDANATDSASDAKISTSSSDTKGESVKSPTRAATTRKTGRTAGDTTVERRQTRRSTRAANT